MFPLANIFPSIGWLKISSNKGLLIFKGFHKSNDIIKLYKKRGIKPLFKTNQPREIVATR